jgi:hypothetical protein
VNPEIHTTLWGLVSGLLIGSLAYELGKWIYRRLRSRGTPKEYSFEIVWPVGRVATTEELEGIDDALKAFMKAVGEGKRLDHK